jgi:hypothetical protein
MCWSWPLWRLVTAIDDSAFDGREVERLMLDVKCRKLEQYALPLLAKRVASAATYSAALHAVFVIDESTAEFTQALRAVLLDKSLSVDHRRSVGSVIAIIDPQFALKYDVARELESLDTLDNEVRP